MTHAEPGSGRPADIDGLLADMRHAYARAVALVRAMPEPGKAFDAATRLTAALRELADSAAGLRGESITAIWQAEELSLAALAKRVGVSKSRANQLIQAAARTSTATREDDHDG